MQCPVLLRGCCPFLSGGVLTYHRFVSQGGVWSSGDQQALGMEDPPPKMAPFLPHFSWGRFGGVVENPLISPKAKVWRSNPIAVSGGGETFGGKAGNSLLGREPVRSSSPSSLGRRACPSWGDLTGLSPDPPQKVLLTFGGLTGILPLNTNRLKSEGTGWLEPPSEVATTEMGGIGKPRQKVWCSYSCSQ